MCTVHILHQIDVPTSDHWRILQHTFWCFRTKTCHAAGRMKSFRKGHVMCRMLSIKRDCFLICFVKNIRCLVGMSYVTTISNNQGNILQTLCKTLLKKTWILLCSTNVWIKNPHNFSGDSEAMLLFFVCSSFQFKITTRLTYLQGKHSQSIDQKYNYHECWCYIIHIKWCFLHTNQWLLLHVLAICL